MVGDNVCLDNGRPGLGDTTPDRARTGINVYNGDHITLRGNRCGNSGGAGDQLYGISVVKSSDVEQDDNALEGNRLATVYN